MAGRRVYPATALALAALAAPAPALAGPALSAAEDAAIAACGATFAAASPDAPAAAAIPAPATLCLNGKLASGTGAQLATQLRALPAAPIIVIRSPGGEVEAAMELAEAVHDRHATVIAVDLCFSSCANYLLAAGRRRIVAPGTLLAFHGGVPQPDRDRLASELRAVGESDPALLDTFLDYATRTRARQDRLLATLGIAPDLFDWMDRFDALPAERQQALCAGDAGGWVLSPPLLARLGYRMDLYAGPMGAAMLRQALADRGRAGGTLCYIDEAALAVWPLALPLGAAPPESSSP